jgi:protein-serine/threonine kinase
MSYHDRMNINGSMNFQVTRSTLERATNAKVKLEKYYESLLQQTVEREARRLLFERDHLDLASSMQERSALEAAFAKKESDFLRLKRLKLSVMDFTSIKVIGKGAFGEVPHIPYTFQF